MADTNAQHMRSLFTEHADQHEAKTVEAEALRLLLDDETHAMTPAEHRLCDEALELLIARNTDSAQALRVHVAELDAATTGSTTPSARRRRPQPISIARDFEMFVRGLITSADYAPYYKDIDAALTRGGWRAGSLAATR